MFTRTLCWQQGRKETRMTESLWGESFCVLNCTNCKTNGWKMFSIPSKKVYGTTHLQKLTSCSLCYLSIITAISCHYHDFAAMSFLPPCDGRMLNCLYAWKTIFWQLSTQIFDKRTVSHAHHVLTCECHLKNTMCQWAVLFPTWFAKCQRPPLCMKFTFLLRH